MPETANFDSNPACATNRIRETSKLMQLINRLGVYVVVAVLLIIGLIVSPTKFLSFENIRNTLQSVSLMGMVAVGMSFVVYSANFCDLSAPMIIAFSGMVTISCIKLGFVPALLIGVFAGTILGSVNGFVIGKLKAHPVIWTMAFNFVLSGIVRWIYMGSQIYPDVIAPDSKAVDMFYNLSRASIPLGSFSLSWMAIVMLVMILLGQVILRRTKFGNQLKIVGSNYEAARLSGINVTRIILIVFMIAAFCFALTGIFFASISKMGAYYNGEGYDFKAVTAVLLGGMTLTGGKGDMIGTFGGALTMGMLTNIMNLIGVSTFEQYMVLGVAFLIIVWITTASDRKLGKS